MKRTARVARTAHDLDHLNRLRVPSFRIVKLFLKAGTKTSKSHLPPEAPPAEGADAGSDDFHYLPEKETIEIHYEIEDKYAMADGGKLELFNRFEETPLWSLDLSVLGPDWVTHGKHTVKWDGRVVKPTAKQDGTPADGGMTHDLTTITVDKTIHDSFPDGYVTLEHPPYKLRLSLTTEADAELKTRPVLAWTYFHILVKSIEFVLGAEETVPAGAVDDERHKMDKAIRSKVDGDGGLPGDGATRKVFLIGNIYKTAGGEMDSNVAHTLHKTMWSDGPNIPIMAKIRLLDSADAEVKVDESDKGAVALGKVRFLWDWEDPDEEVDAQQSQPKPKAFIKDAINYDKAVSEPKGDNCHLDRGGKRGTGAKPVFPDQAGYDPKDTLDAGKFPFLVLSSDSAEERRPKERKWASYSQAWTKGKLKGQTGIVFQPSRMAGDNYKLTVYVAFDRNKKDGITLDAKTQPIKAPDAIKKSTGTFQVWREIHQARYIRKKSTIAAFLPANLGGAQTLYKEAYVAFENKMDGDNQYTMDQHQIGGVTLDYNQMCEDVFAASGNSMYDAGLAVEAGADHASVDSAFLVRTYAKFIETLHEALDATGTGDWASEGIAPEDLGSTALPDPATVDPARFDAVTRLAATKAWIDGTLETSAKYIGMLDDQLCTFIESELCTKMSLISGGKAGVNTAAVDGVTVVHFNYTNTYMRDRIAAGDNVGSVFGSAVDPADAGRSKCAFLFLSPRLDTFVHEIGHHLFLPHAPTAGGYQENRHDGSDTGCIMSYNRPRPAFCGLCQLRLRGWDADVVNKTSASNKKP